MSRGGGNQEPGVQNPLIFYIPGIVVIMFLTVLCDNISAPIVSSKYSAMSLAMKCDRMENV